MRVDLLTREYPPHVYGGAGVHVAELAKVLRAQVDLRVRCFDGPRSESGVEGYTLGFPTGDASLDVIAQNLPMASDCFGADLVHSQTWYTNGAGILASALHGIPHLLTAHSLEPKRPWKADQLGGGYRVSSWIERTAYQGADGIIAVSRSMRDDILEVYPFVDPAGVHVIHNGIDVVKWSPLADDEKSAAEETIRRYGMEPGRPTVVFVGRITHQKGLVHLLRAAEGLPADVQVVLCAGAPDTPQTAEETHGLLRSLMGSRNGVVWIEEMVPQPDLRAILAASTVLACPSIYEPLGIVNLEAAAMGLPVVASKVGGIPEVVEDGVTGALVPIDLEGGEAGAPRDTERFAADLRDALTTVIADPGKAAEMGRAGRKRVEREFSWEAIGKQTVAVYEALLGASG